MGSLSAKTYEQSPVSLFCLCGGWFLFLSFSAILINLLWSCCRFPAVAMEEKAGVPHQVDRLDFACSIIKCPPPASREDGM